MSPETAVDDRVQIRPITTEDFAYVLKWSKDDVFCDANEWERNRNETELSSWWLRCVNQRADDFIRMGIELDYQLIGYVDLAHIENHSAELGIAIGDSELWGIGVGYSASRRMMEYGSTHLGIRIFTAETHETNRRSQKMLERLGFHEVSRVGSEYYLGADAALIQYRLTL